MHASFLHFQDSESASARRELSAVVARTHKRDSRREFKFHPRKDSITVRESRGIPPGNRPVAVVSRSAARCKRDAASLFYFIIL